WYQEPKFLIKMPPRRTRNINDVYDRIMERMEERLDQFVDQFANRMNDMMNLRRYKDRDYGMAGDDYEGVLVFDDDYEKAPIFNDDQFEEESMPVYDTDIKDVIEEEEGFVGKGGFGNLVDVSILIGKKYQEGYLKAKPMDDKFGFKTIKGDYDVADYEGPPVFDDDQFEDELEEEEGFVGKGFVDSYPNFQEDENNVSFSGVVLGVEESMPVYDTDIKDVIEEEEGFVGYFSGKEDLMGKKTTSKTS
ncbi:hypothetical protein Tco_1180426, partial [Tanacetum coccineum]